MEVTQKPYRNQVSHADYARAPGEGTGDQPNLYRTTAGNGVGVRGTCDVVYYLNRTVCVGVLASLSEVTWTCGGRTLLGRDERCTPKLVCGL